MPKRKKSMQDPPVIDFERELALDLEHVGRSYVNTCSLVCLRAARQGVPRETILKIHNRIVEVLAGEFSASYQALPDISQNKPPLRN